MRKHSWLILTSCFRLPIHQRLRVPDHRPPAVPGAKRSHQRQTTWKLGKPRYYRLITITGPIHQGILPETNSNFAWKSRLKIIGWKMTFDLLGDIPYFQLRTVSFRDGISSSSSTSNSSLAEILDVGNWKFTGFRWCWAGHEGFFSIKKTLLLEALIQSLLTFPTRETICRGFLTRVQLMGHFLVLYYTLYTAYLWYPTAELENINIFRLKPLWTQSNKWLT